MKATVHDTTSISGPEERNLVSSLLQLLEIIPRNWIFRHSVMIINGFDMSELIFQVIPLIFSSRSRLSLPSWNTRGIDEIDKPRYADYCSFNRSRLDLSIWMHCVVSVRELFLQPASINNNYYQRKRQLNEKHQLKHRHNWSVLMRILIEKKF